ncbi:hypothetical protein CRG98_017622 [Punica granatum]|uniref:Uncharacterized protein n=1 Tax=Punica granatum TaxID=22663 RepID=A0A2I0K1K0_PUNGR|nr:hypothetical protein CRG98_017622 [Punica granatum]
MGGDGEGIGSDGCKKDLKFVVEGRGKPLGAAGFGFEPRLIAAKPQLGDLAEILGLTCGMCSPNVSRCSGTAVISVFHECAPKVRREAFVTTETSLGKPRRVLKGPFSGAVYSSVDRAPPEPRQKRRLEPVGQNRVLTATNASRQTFGARFDKRRSQWSPNTSENLGTTKRAPFADS